MSTQPALFSPIKVGNNKLTHRVVLAPMTRFRATREAVPTDLQAEHYKQRSSEGGLLISEATFIGRLAGGYPCVPGLYNKEQIEGWKKVTAAVHEKKAFIYAQLWHLGRLGSKAMNPNQEQVIGASAIACPGKSMAGHAYEEPRALTVEEIKEIIHQYVQAAENAIEAGFDGVEIHGAVGFLVDQFINISSNNRTDDYGGSIENRGRFALELVDAIAKAIGDERTAIRFSPSSDLHGMNEEDPVKTWSYLSEQLQKNHPNLAYLHFIEPRSNPMDDTPVDVQDALGPYREIWKGPFISSCGFSNAIKTAADLAERTGDLISYGRAFIANPDLPERLRNGWELNKYDRSTFYSNGAEGYNDYPFYNQTKSN